MVTSESNLFFDPIHRQKPGRFQMALVEKPLCRNWSAASSEQFVNLRLQNAMAYPVAALPFTLSLPLVPSPARRAANGAAICAKGHV
jgi:hypothetical protein